MEQLGFVSLPHHRVVVVESISHLQLFETLWTISHQALLSMGFSRREYRSGLPCPSPGDLPNPGIEPRSPILQADSLPTATREAVVDPSLALVYVGQPFYT